MSKSEWIKYISVVIVSLAVSIAASIAVNKYELTKKSDTAFSESLTKSTIFPKNELGEETIANLVETISPSVVHISTETELKVRKYAPSQEFFFEDDFFKRFFGQTPFGMEERIVPYKQSGTGSGVIISDDGYILTNFHVVKDATEIVVKTFDEKTYAAKLIGKDKYSDLAVIKINHKGLKAAKLADSDKLRPGQWAIAVGSPHGLDNTVTLGIISAIRRNIPQLSNISLLQTDAAINPGNSGGPLLNIKGEVVGINTAIMGTAQNIGFAIPVNTAKSVVNDLKAGKAIGHPWLGVALSPINDDIAQALNVDKNTKGVVIARIVEGSPAQKAGLEQGDIIQRINGNTIETSEQVQKEVRSSKVGDKLSVLILRNGSILGKKIKIGTWQE